MTDYAINVAGIEIPSSDPVFLAVVGVHVLFGLVCTIAGAIAMLSVKRRGPHPSFGSIYFWCLGGVFVTAAALAAVRWAEDYDLLILGALAFAVASMGAWRVANAGATGSGCISLAWGCHTFCC